MIEARDSSVVRERWNDTHPEKGKTAEGIGQGADSWDVAEYAPYCHLGEALSDVTYTVMYNRYHECVSECICGIFYVIENSAGISCYIKISQEIAQ